jgi:catechol 2,3-dioxygenase
VERFGIPAPGYRLPDATRLGVVRLQVGELDRSLEYYDTVLGMRTLTCDGDTATLGAFGDDRPLVSLHARPGVRPVPRRGLFGLYHFAILLPSRAALGRFLAHLSDMGVYPGTADHAVSESLYLHDPDGLGIEVYADRPRSVWRVDARQLHMTTEPLDVRGVLAAGEGQRWTGTPRGTVIGHVHLHVGNLDRASAFYHTGLGFDKVVWDYPGALFMSAGGYHHHLGTNTWSPGPGAAETDARLLSWDVVVPGAADAEAAVRSLSAAGHLVTRHDDGPWAAADPWGTIVRIVAG